MRYVPILAIMAVLLVVSESSAQYSRQRTVFVQRGPVFAPHGNVRANFAFRQRVFAPRIYSRTYSYSTLGYQQFVPQDQYYAPPVQQEFAPVPVPCAPCEQQQLQFAPAQLYAPSVFQFRSFNRFRSFRRY